MTFFSVKNYDVRNSIKIVLQVPQINITILSWKSNAIVYFLYMNYWIDKVMKIIWKYNKCKYAICNYIYENTFYLRHTKGVIQ